MRLSLGAVSAATVLLAAAAVAQQPAGDASRKVEKGGMHVAGWTGRVDASRENTGLTLSDAKFETMGDGFHLTTGPALAVWNPANVATGNYTVKATFTESKFQGLNSHPHPYGIMIAGNDLGTDRASYLYCSAYGTGNFIVRGFGPQPFQVNGRRPEPNAAIRKAEGVGKPVTNEVALSVKGDKVECAVNGTVVGSYDKSAVVGAGKLTSTDGVYGIRAGHNTEVHVSGFTVVKH